MFIAKGEPRRFEPPHMHAHIMKIEKRTDWGGGGGGGGKQLSTIIICADKHICDPSREKGRVGCHIVKFTFSAF